MQTSKEGISIATLSSPTVTPMGERPTSTKSMRMRLPSEKGSRISPAKTGRRQHHAIDPNCPYSHDPKTWKAYDKDKAWTSWKNTWKSHDSNSGQGKAQGSGQEQPGQGGANVKKVVTVGVSIFEVNLNGDPENSCAL